MSQESNILPPEAGASFDGGRVTLDVPLGAGGMGSVWRGRLTGHSAPVAVKVPHLAGLEPADRRALVSRLLDEATAAGRVTHPNVVRILASGDCPQGGPYIVYELVEGGSLEERLVAGPLPWEEVEEHLAPQLLGALEALHAAGVVHRDVKPDNIFVTPDGRYLLGDLGLAVFEGRSAATATGVVVGTPGYLAPERMTAPDTLPTPVTDVYAAAMVLIRSAAGRLPFRDGPPAALVRDQITKDLTPRDLAIAGLPRAVARVLASAVTRDPARRPPSAAILLERLRQPEPEGLPLAPTVALANPVASPGRQTGEPRGAFPGRRVLGALMVLALCSTFLGVRWSGGNVTQSGSMAPPDVAVPLVTGTLLVEDATTGAVLEELLPLATKVRAGDDVSRARLDAYVRSVGLRASTTSPLYAVVDDVRLVAGGGGSEGADRRRDRLDAAHARYAAALAVATLHAGTSMRLFVLMTATVGRLALTGGVPPEPGGPLDSLVVRSYGVLAGLPGKARGSVPGRSLAAVLDLLLARATPSGDLPHPMSARSMGLLAADGDLLPEVSDLGVQLGLPPVEGWRSTWSDDLALPALEGRQRRRVLLVGLRPPGLGGLPASVDLETGESIPYGEAVASVVEDWYRLVPLAHRGSVADVGSPPECLWTTGMGVVRLLPDPGRFVALRPLSVGPFQVRPLVARLSVGMADLAVGAAGGNLPARRLLYRALDDWARALRDARLLDVPPFVAAVRGPLVDAPHCRYVLLGIDAEVAACSPGRSDAGVLAAAACRASLSEAEGQGEGLVTEDMEAVLFALERLRLLTLGRETVSALQECRSRARRLIDEAEARGASSRVAPRVLDEIGRELTKRTEADYVGTAEP